MSSEWELTPDDKPEGPFTMNSVKHLLLLLASMGLFGCADKKTRSNVEFPGSDKTPKTSLLETGASMLQKATDHGSDSGDDQAA